MKVKIEIPKGWRKLPNGSKVRDGDRFFWFSTYNFSEDYEWRLLKEKEEFCLVDNEVEIVIRKVK